MNYVGKQPFSSAYSGKVAVITRTRNRPLLLQRAGRSVGHQSYKNYLWVVVNDGGNAGEVKDVVAASGIPSERVRVLSHNSSRGMEAASNSGIQSSDSEYIVIHDDDDSWTPNFLSETVHFMASPAGEGFGGVVTRSTRITERLCDGKVVPLRSEPYLPDGTTIRLADLLTRNLFPPVSFLYRRKWWQAVGGYNERLKVLGDWAFNLEFLSRANIAVLPKALANYHVREALTVLGDSPDAEAYANSVIKERAEHEATSAVVLNDYLRRNTSHSDNVLVAMLGAMVKDSHETLRQNGVDPDGARVARAYGQGAPAPSVQLLDDYDRCWVTLQFNALLRARRRRIHGASMRLRSLAPDSDWSGVLDAVRRSGIVVPAPADFDSDAYLRKFPDVDSAVQRGILPSAYMHYLLHGRSEGRARLVKTR